MHPRLVALIHGHEGALSVGDAARVGVSARSLDGLQRSGELIRVRRGAYVLSSLYRAADQDERHRLRIRAVLRSRPPLDAASHHAALLMEGIPTYGTDHSVIDVIAAVNAVRMRSGLRTHPLGHLPVTVVRGWRIVGLPVALVQVAGWSGSVAGVVSMDHAVHNGLCTLPELRYALASVPTHQRAEAAQAITLVDPACESVGESRTRLLLGDLGFASRSQVRIRRPGGTIARVDFLVDGLVIVEFDGLVKYAGATGRDALAAEKARESDLLALGFEVVRLTWSDLDDSAEVARRIRVARNRAILRQRAAG